MSSRRAFSVSIFCRHEGAILLIRHKRLGQWLPISNEIEQEETPLEATHRELLEETSLEGRFPEKLGVDGTPPDFLGYEEHLAGSKGLHMNFTFVADVASRDLVGCDEYDEVVWVRGTDEIECPPNVRQLVALALERAK